MNYERLATMKTINCRTTAEGQRVAYVKKLAWNKVYYSFDGERSWHPTKTAAYLTAKAAGLLAVVDGRGIAVRTVDG